MYWFIFFNINIFWKWRFFLHSWNWPLVNKSVLILKIYQNLFSLPTWLLLSYALLYAKMLRCGPPSGKNRSLVCFFGGLQNARLVVEVEQQTHGNVVVQPSFQDWTQTLWNDISARGEATHSSPANPYVYDVFTTLQAHLITVGVISAQKKMLSVLTAWEENIPMMENATENFLFKVSRKTVHRNKNGQYSVRKIWPKSKEWVWCSHLCHVEGCISQSLNSTGEHWNEKRCDISKQRMAQCWRKWESQPGLKLPPPCFSI